MIVCNGWGFARLRDGWRAWRASDAVGLYWLVGRYDGKPTTRDAVCNYEGSRQPRRLPTDTIGCSLISASVRAINANYVRSVLYV